MLHLSERVRAEPALAWSFALACFALALAARFASNDVLPPGFPYLTFFPAVILTAFFAGLWPAVACATLSGLAAWYWFIAPVGSFTITGSVVVALVFYVFIVAVDIGVIEAMHIANGKLDVERRKSQDLAERQNDLLNEMRERQQRQTVLQHELAHRMKNTLAMVQAIVNQSFRATSDPREAAAAVEARIAAIGRSLETLTEARWESAELRPILEGALRPHLDGPERISMNGPDVLLGATQSMGLALAIHELATNATKYGALSGPEGSVSLIWTIGPEGAFTLDWRERGGPMVQEPAKRGFGSRLIEKIVPGYFKGRAQLSYRPEGLGYSLTGHLEAADGRIGGAAPVQT